MIFLSSIINEIAHEIEIYLFSENIRKSFSKLHTLKAFRIYFISTENFEELSELISLPTGVEAQEFLIFSEKRLHKGLLALRSLGADAVLVIKNLEHLLGLSNDFHKASIVLVAFLVLVLDFLLQKLDPLHGHFQSGNDFSRS